MRRFFVFSFMAFVLMGFSAQAGQTPPLVDAQWVKDNLGKPGIVILDLQGQRGYARIHIPGSISTEYGHWRNVDKNGVRGQLPPSDKLEQLIGGLGIGNDTHVVLAPIGQHAGDVAMATRIFWTFRAIGHEAVSILNGGLVEYAIKQKFALDKTPVKPKAKKYKASPVGGFQGVKQDLLKAIEAKQSIVDARSLKEYQGKVAGRGERPGTVPGAKLLPYDTLTARGSGAFPDVATLESFFKQANVPVSGDQIHFCHTGNRASLSWFVAHELLGNKAAKMYDASMLEWAKDKSLPMIIPE